MKFCKHCGKEINEKAIVCIHCGRSVEEQQEKQKKINVKVENNNIIYNSGEGFKRLYATSEAAYYTDLMNISKIVEEQTGTAPTIIRFI